VRQGFDCRAQGILQQTRQGSDPRQILQSFQPWDQRYLLLYQVLQL
jgi:hypothetical protein